MSHMRPFHVAGLLAAVALIGACGDDDDTADTTVVETTATTEPAPATESTAAPTTAETTTTTAPPTTIDQIAVTKQAVAAAAVQSRQDYLYAVRNHDAADAIEVLSRSHAANSPSLRLALSNMETLRSNGWRSRENPELPSVLTVESEVVLLDGPQATRAELTACVIDSGVVYEPGGAPDGSDTIVNDEINLNRNRITMVLEDGAWKLFDGENLASWNEGTTCPPA